MAVTPTPSAPLPDAGAHRTTEAPISMPTESREQVKQTDRNERMGLGTQARTMPSTGRGKTTDVAGHEVAGAGDIRVS